MTSIFNIFSNLDNLKPQNNDHVRTYKRENVNRQIPTPSLSQGQNFNKYQQQIFHKYEKDMYRVNTKEGFTSYSSSGSSNSANGSSSSNSATQQSQNVLNQTQITSSQSQSYEALKKEYISTLARYEHILKEIHKNAAKYLARVNPKNPYLNKTIQFSSGETFYVTNQGVARFIPNQSVWNSTSIPTHVVPINIPWHFKYLNPGTTIPLKPSLVTGSYVTMNEMIGNEGSNVYVNQGVYDPSYHYIGCYADNSNTRGLPNQVQSSAQNYDASTCMQAAIDNGDRFFGLQNVDLTTGLGQCWTGSSGSQAKQYGKGQQNCTQQSDGFFYGGNNSNAIYETPSAVKVGRYFDKPNRAMIPVNNYSQTYTYDTCMQYALDGSYQYFALQDINKKKTAGQCFVSNDFTTASQYGKATKKKNDGVKTHEKGKDGHKYGTAWVNMIYEITGGAPYEGCYNDVSGSAMTPVDNGSSSYTYDTCQQYASSNGYKYFGLQNAQSVTTTTSSSGKKNKNKGSTTTTSVAAQCFVSNDLSGAEQYGQEEPCPNINGQNFGSSMINALYRINKINGSTNFNSSQIGSMGYIDENSNLYAYPDSNLQLSSNYTMYTNYDSPGNDIQNASISGTTIDNCESTCTINQDCYGFTYDLSNNICYPKTSSIYPNSARQPSNSMNLYVRNKSISKPPLGVTSNIKNVDSLTYNTFTNSGQQTGSAYGLANVSSTQKQELEQIQSTLKSLAQQIVDLNGTFNENDLLVNTQTTTNMQSVDQYLSELNKIKSNIKNFDDNYTNILNDSDIVVLQENYNYMFWSILAVGTVLIAMNIAKK